VTKKKKVFIKDCHQLYSFAKLEGSGDRLVGRQGGGVVGKHRPVVDGRLRKLWTMS